MKKWKIIAISIIGMILTSGTIAGAMIIASTDKTNQIKQPKIEIVDIKYEDGYIIAELYSEVSYRTVPIYFYKARLIGDKVGYKTLFGTKFACTVAGKSWNVSQRFIYHGGFLITVEIPDIDKYSEEVHVPIIESKNRYNFSKLLSNYLKNFFIGVE
jgi:hypothetical protein